MLASSHFCDYKKDLIHRKRFKIRVEARKAINHYISSFYNERRKHSTLGNCSPNNFEKNNYRSPIFAKVTEFHDEVTGIP